MKIKFLIFIVFVPMLFISCGPNAEEIAEIQKKAMMTQKAYDDSIAIVKANKTIIDEHNNYISNLEKEKLSQQNIIDEAERYFATTIPCGSGGAHGKYKRKESDGSVVCSEKYGDLWYDYDQKSKAAKKYIDVINKKITEAKEKINSLK